MRVFWGHPVRARADAVLDPRGRFVRILVPLATGRRLADDDAARQCGEERAPRPGLAGLLRRAREGARAVTHREREEDEETGAAACHLVAVLRN